MRLSKVIKKPIVTEKQTMLQKQGKYIFEVDLKASKGAIGNEVKRLFGVSVVDIKTISLPGKKRRIRGTFRFTKTSPKKKAIVQIKSGQKIEIFPGSEK